MKQEKKFLRRDRLQSLFCRGIDGSLFTVVAGAGYGKTKEVREFFKSRKSERVIWLSLNAYDNIATNFWHSFTKSVNACLPDTERLLDQIGFPDSSGKFDTVLHILSKDIYKGRKVVLVVDNYDLVRNQDVRLFFEYIVQTGLENFCLVIISNIKADMDIKSLADLSSVYGISNDELKFTADETKAFLQLYDIELTDECFNDLVARVDGCPLALNIFVQGYDSILNSAGCIKFATKSLFESIFDDKYFSLYGQNGKALLLKLSFFRKFPLELVRVLDKDGTGNDTDIIRHNIFIDYDEKTKFFEFQKLYYDFLQTKHGELSFEEIKDVYDAAGGCFMQRCMYQEAVHCYFNAENYDMFMQALMKFPCTKHTKDHCDNILAYLNALPEDFTRGNLWVKYIKGFLLLNNMHVDEAYKIFIDMKNSFEQKESLSVDESHFLGELYLVLADISMLKGDCAFLGCYKNAGRYLNNGSQMRNKSIFFLGNNDAFFLPDRPDITVGDMVNLVFDAAPYIADLTGGSGMGFEWLFAAEAAFLQYDFDRSKDFCIKAISSAFKKEQHDIVCNSYFLIARIAALQGNYEYAEKQIGKIVMYIDVNCITELFELRDCVVSWFNLLRGDFDKVSNWIVLHDDGYYARLPIDTGRNNFIFLSYLLFKGDFQGANDFLDKSSDMFSQKKLWVLRLHFYLMKSVCLFNLGDKDRALDEFKKAYVMTYYNDISTPFMEYGMLIKDMLVFIEESVGHGLDREWLVSIRQKALLGAEVYSKFADEANNLTRIEVVPKNMLDDNQMRILKLLSGGMLKSEVEKAMNITSIKLKKEIVSICMKLGSINMPDAIKIARTRKYI